MSTSRTGTTKWKQLRKKLLQQAINNGQTNCPYCNITLDYQTGTNPNSATIDHKTPYALTQDDTPDNLQVICRRCNSSKNNRTHPTQTAPLQPKQPQTLNAW